MSVIELSFSHQDTKLATMQNRQLVYFFSSELDKGVKNELISKSTLTKLCLARQANTEVWVYKKLNDRLTLINEGQPFKSKLQASLSLKISTKKISKLIDTQYLF